jgi:hypothetical protein
MTDPRKSARNGPGFRAMLTAGAVLLFVAALGATLIAYLVWVLHCDETPQELCGHAGLAKAQLVVALAGLLPGAWLVGANAAGRARAATLAFGVVAMVYVGWFSLLVML